MVAMISGIAKKDSPEEVKVRVGDERLLKVSESASTKVRSVAAGPGKTSTVMMQHFVSYVRGANNLPGVAP